MMARGALQLCYYGVLYCYRLRMCSLIRHPCGILSLQLSACQAVLPADDVPACRLLAPVFAVTFSVPDERQHQQRVMHCFPCAATSIHPCTMGASRTPIVYATTVSCSRGIC